MIVYEVNLQIDSEVADEYAEVSGLTGGDCDDQNDAIYTGAEDTWYDGIDSNCDELNDYDKLHSLWIMHLYLGSSLYYIHDKRYDHSGHNQLQLKLY